MRLLFLGDSLVAFHDWQSRFPGHKAINGGRAGETVAGLLADLPGHLRSCPAPERVFIMIGANNLLREDYGFLPEYAEILAGLAPVLPPARVTVTGLPPLRAAHLAPSVIPRINDGLRRLSRRQETAFLDLAAAFAAHAPATEACFADDGVHLSPLGYAIWSASLARSL